MTSLVNKFYLTLYQDALSFVLILTVEKFVTWLSGLGTNIILWYDFENIEVRGLWKMLDISEFLSAFEKNTTESYRAQFMEMCSGINS